MSNIPPPPAPGSDPKAAAAAAKAYAKAQRPWFKKKRFIVPLAIVAIVVVASLASGGDGTEDRADAGDIPASDLSTNEDNPPGADVEVTGCDVDATFGLATVALQITNHSSKPSDYLITLGFTDESGARVGDGFASTNNVAPDQVANVDGTGTVSDAAVGSVTCTVDEVERLAS